jgi:methyl-accepting chemotaxis protein
MRAMTVKVQLLLLIGIILLSLLSLGYTGYSGTTKQGETLFDMDIKLTGLRNQMDADMMHDAIRADVLNALYSSKSGGDVAAIQETVTDFNKHAEKFRADIKDTLDADISPEINETLQKATPLLESYLSSAEEIMNLSTTDLATAETKYPKFLENFHQLEAEMANFSDMITSASNDASITATEVSENSLQLMIWVIIGAVAVIVIGAALMLRSILMPLNKLYNAICAIRSNTGALERLRGFHGEFRNIEGAFNGVLDDMEAQRMEETHKAEAAIRVQQALNAAATSVVLTDANMLVIYVNDTAQRMFAQYEGIIRRTLPSFKAAELVGGTLTQFFSDSNIVSGIQQLSAPRRDEIVLGNLTFQINSTAVNDELGSRLGVVCEWSNLTEQRDAEQQIEAVLKEAINGRLDARLDASRFQGFMNVLSDSVNRMLDALTTPLRSAAAHLQQIAEGHIPDPITTEFKGDFNEIRNNLNTCSTVLRALIRDTKMLVESASQGKLDQRVDTSAHWGDYRAIVEGMNNTLDAVAKPISEVKVVMSGLANGDLTLRMQGNYSGDFAVLSDAVNMSVNNLVELVSKITATAYHINSSATEISSGNQNLNDRTQEQAAALEETTATLTGLSSKAEENTNNSANANTLAQSATQEARKGGEIVNRAVKAMSEIDGASKKIADIISVIDSIAFQTNLLALNASVEAARAGDQGKGFAVVASEVRALAGRSATAAQEIKALINDTVEKVNQGTKLVNESGNTLRDIVGSISKVGVIISEISSATSDQMSGFHEVSKAIGQLDNTTQQNAAMVEEAAAASESMADQSDTLRELMGFFKTDEKQTQTTPKASKATATSAAKTPARKPVTPSAGTGARTVARKPVAVAAKPALKVVAGNQQMDAQWDEF